MSLTAAEYDRKGTQAEAAHNADQAEWKAVRLGSANIDEGVRDDRLAESPGEFPDEEPLSIGGPELKLERLASETHDEIDRRAKLMGDAYPFKVEGNTLIHEPSSTGVYEFCLSISFVPTISKAPYVRLQIGFERLIRDLMVLFLGPGSRGYRTGHPPDAHEHRPTKIKAVIQHLANEAGEWIWQPDPGLPDDPSYKQQKDLGLDVVIWKKLPDKRKGYLCCIGQCACGRTDWETKFYDIADQKLSCWLKPVCFVAPIRVFAIPFHIPNDPYFGMVCKQAGLLLDRARIVMLAQRPDHQASVTGSAIEKYADLAEIVRSAPVVDRPAPGRRRRTRGAARRSRSTGSDSEPSTR